MAIAEDYRDRPNIGRVMHVCEVIAREVAEVSSLRRLHKGN